MEISVLAIDLAKSVFQLHGNDANGRCLLRKKLRRSELRPFIALLPPCIVAMEACSGAQYWAREFRSFGHEVRLIAPQFVKPFVKTNKNDSADAEAIAEAAVRPNMRFVPIKERWQQDLLAIHRTRSLLIGHRVAVSNALRGFLAEQGLVFATGDGALKKGLQELLGRSEAAVSVEFAEILQALSGQLRRLAEQIEELDRKLEAVARRDERCKRLQKIEGVGPIISTAILGTIGDAREFKNGRQLSAFWGLVPRQSSSGGKQQLLGISKRGDGYIRKLLIHGARSAVQWAGKKDTQRNRWVLEKVRTRGMNKATVALANKNARVIWAVLAKGEHYRAAA
jgi:transposase